MTALRGPLADDILRLRAVTAEGLARRSTDLHRLYADVCVGAAALQDDRAQLDAFRENFPQEDADGVRHLRDPDVRERLWQLVGYLDAWAIMKREDTGDQS